MPPATQGSHLLAVFMKFPIDVAESVNILTVLALESPVLPSPVGFPSPPPADPWPPVILSNDSATLSPAVKALSTLEGSCGVPGTGAGAGAAPSTGGFRFGKARSNLSVIGFVIDSPACATASLFAAAASEAVSIAC